MTSGGAQFIALPNEIKNNILGHYFHDKAIFHIYRGDFDRISDIDEREATFPVFLICKKLFSPSQIIDAMLSHALFHVESLDELTRVRTISIPQMALVRKLQILNRVDEDDLESLRNVVGRIDKLHNLRTIILDEHQESGIDLGLEDGTRLFSNIHLERGPIANIIYCRDSLCHRPHGPLVEDIEKSHYGLLELERDLRRSRVVAESLPTIHTRSLFEQCLFSKSSYGSYLAPMFDQGLEIVVHTDYVFVVPIPSVWNGSDQLPCLCMVQFNKRARLSTKDMMLRIQMGTRDMCIPQIFSNPKLPATWPRSHPCYDVKE